MNGLLNINNKPLLLNKYKYIDVYNYFKEDNNTTNSENNINNYIISLLKSVNSKLLDGTMIAIKENMLIYKKTHKPKITRVHYNNPFH